MEDVLKKLSFCSGTTADVIWHLIFYLNVNPRELRENREMQKAALARYLRQSVLQWDDVECNEITAWFERMKTLLENEAPTRSLSEDP
jgi:hypothetical protein